jgi:hypothetical protein
MVVLGVSYGKIIERTASLHVRLGFHSFAPFLSELDSIFRSRLARVTVRAFARESAVETDQDSDDASLQIRFGFHRYLLLNMSIQSLYN